jgi:hypothetical protein
MEFDMEVFEALFIFVAPLVVIAGIALWIIERGSNGG